MFSGRVNCRRCYNFRMSDSPVTTLRTSRLGAASTCDACGANSLLSFNWHHAIERGTADGLNHVATFREWQKLRRGQFFRCGVCNEVWYLDAGPGNLTHVQPERLPLVLAWSENAITLSAANLAIVDSIGPTPPDVYGNGRERRVTPCQVTTHAGERFDKAFICVQADAPVASHINFRLGSEIADVKESPFALPRAVREASSRAYEIRMGYSPTLIEMPGGAKFIMNGMTSFMAVPGYEASQARLASGGDMTLEAAPRFVETPDDVVYFIMDGAPDWSADMYSDGPVTSPPPKTVPSVRKTWRQRITGCFV